MRRSTVQDYSNVARVLLMAAAIPCFAGDDGRTTSVRNGSATTHQGLRDEQSRCPEGSYMKSATFKPNLRGDKLLINCVKITNGAMGGSPSVSACLACVPGADGFAYQFDSIKSNSSGYCVYRKSTSASC